MQALARVLGGLGVVFHVDHTGGSMNLVSRAQNIITKPKEEWLVVAQETPNVGGIITGYVIPLSLLPAIGSLLGGMFFLGGFLWGVPMAIVAILSAIVGTYITALVVDAMAGSFGSEKDMGRSFQLVAYSATPAWVAGLLNIIPFLGFVTWIGWLYGIYVLYLGLEPIKKTPEDKKVVYTIVALIVAGIIQAIFMTLIGGILIAMIVGTATIGAGVSNW